MENSVMLRLDPKTVFSYICKNDRNNGSSTSFILRPLTVLGYRSCEELHPRFSGNFILRVLMYGLVGWDNFAFENGEVIPFNVENFSAISPHYQQELAEKIMELSEVDDDLASELRLIARWSDWLSRADKAYQWDCEYCVDHKMFKSRNCDGALTWICPSCQENNNDDTCSACGVKKRLKFKFRFSNRNNDFVTRCPLGLLTSRSIKLTNLINYIDNSKSLPFKEGALEQSNFFYVVRAIVLSEQNAMLKEEMDRLKKEADAKTKKNTGKR